MIGKKLVRPLEDDWRETLDAIARARRFPTTAEAAKLSSNVAALSRAYNEGASMPRGDAVLSARLSFSFVRDVPKAAGAVRELVASGALRCSAERPLRLLDLGAGLGASTWGVARALEAAGQTGAIEATLIDGDAAALDVAQAIVRARLASGSAVSLTATTVQHDLARGLPRLAGRFDVVVLGQVLSELDASLDEVARVTKHAALLLELLAGVTAADGALVVIEPALRDRTRHLHRVRDALLASRPGAVFAPCLHQAACPALARETDWCHEDLPVDLPPWLAPIARGAGLRYQGLTFSYLVLRSDGATLASPEKKQLRVVSDRFVSKGKSEAFLCGALAGGPGRVRAMRLDRDEGPPNEAWDAIERGDVLTIEPPLDEAKPRVAKEARLTRD